MERTKTTVTTKTERIELDPEDVERACRELVEKHLGIKTEGNGIACEVVITNGQVPRATVTVVKVTNA